MDMREQIYRELVKNEHPSQLEDLWGKLDLFNRTHDMDVKLKAEDIIDVLLRYISGRLSEQQVEDWANLLECVSYEVGGIGDESIVDAIHDLANPALEGLLTRQSAEALIRRLQENLLDENKTGIKGVEAGLHISLEKIKTVLRIADIEGLIESGAPDDEYDSEAEEIMQALSMMEIESLNEEAMLSVIADVWEDYFHLDENQIAQAMPYFRDMGQKILAEEEQA